MPERDGHALRAEALVTLAEATRAANSALDEMPAHHILSILTRRKQTLQQIAQLCLSSLPSPPGAMSLRSRFEDGDRCGLPSRHACRVGASTSPINLMWVGRPES